MPDTTNIDPGNRNKIPVPRTVHSFLFVIALPYVSGSFAAATSCNSEIGECAGVDDDSQSLLQYTAQVERNVFPEAKANAKSKAAMAKNRFTSIAPLMQRTDQLVEFEQGAAHKGRHQVSVSSLSQIHAVPANGLAQPARVSLVAASTAAMVVTVLVLLSWYAPSEARGSANSGDAEVICVRRRRVLQVLELTIEFLYMVGFMAMQASSYDLVKDLGYGATESGLLLGASWLLTVVGAVMQVMWLAKPSCPWKRLVVVVTIVGQMVLAVLQAFAANPPDALPMNSSARLAMLAFSRLGVGFLIGLCPFWLMVVKITPDDELVPFAFAGSCIRNVGLGVGPLLSTTSEWVFHPVGVRAVAATPYYVISVVWAAVAVAVMLLCPSPSNFEKLTARQPSETETENQHEVAARTVQNLKDDFSSEIEVSSASADYEHRKYIWLLGAFICMERNFMVSALEATTSLILEIEFGFGTSDIGLTIGMTFIIGFPMLLLMEKIRCMRLASDGGLIFLTTAISTVAVLLLIKRIGTTLGKDSFFLVLLADCVIFAMKPCSGIAEGLLLEHSMPGTYFSTESYVIVNTLMEDSLARFLGPLMGRFLVGSYSRDAYAGFQFVLSLLSVSTVVAMMQSLSRHGKGSL